MGGDVFKKHFLIHKEKTNSMYDSNKPVYILKQNGTADNLAKCSDMTKELLEREYVYYSREMAEKYMG